MPTNIERSDLFCITMPKVTLVLVSNYLYVCNPYQPVALGYRNVKIRIRGYQQSIMLPH